MRHLVLAVTLAVLSVCGCSAMQGLVRTTGELVGLTHEAPVVELPPQPEPAIQAGWGVMAGVVYDFLRKPALDAVEGYRALMAECQQVLVAEHGMPAVLPETVPEIRRSLASVQALQTDRQVALAEDGARRTQAAVKSQTSRWSLHSGALGTYILMGAGASLGALALWALKKAGKATVRYLSLSGAIETAGVLVPGAADAVKAVLRTQPQAVQDDLRKTRVRAGG